MTQRNQRNHYNVKLLRGFGVSISLKDSKIILKNGRHDITGEQESEEWFVNNMPYEKIVISGKGYVSTEALSLITQKNRNVILVDTYGKPVTYCNSMMDSLTGTKYRIAQYDTFRDKSKCEYLTKQIISAKRESQLKLLKMIRSNVTELPESEHLASKVYFKEFSKFIPERYGFVSRNQSFIRTSKNNATDIINALLNYGYSVLAGEVSKFVCKFGLDPYYGFMHKSHTEFQPLVYDIIEPFRWLVDYSVWKIANNQDKRRRIKLKEFVFTKNGSIVLDENLIKRFLERLEKTFQMEREYTFNQGRKMKNGMSMCQEITIVKIFIESILKTEIVKQNKNSMMI